MSVLDLYVDGFPHGLPAGFERGCRGARECSNFGTELPLCRDAAIRYRSDYGYKKLVDQGLTPEEIVERERAAAEAMRPQVVAARVARAEKAEVVRRAEREKARVKAEREAARAQARVEKAAPVRRPVDPAEVEAVRVRLQAARIELRRAVKGASKAHSAVWAAEQVLEERRAGLVEAVRRRAAAEKAVEVSLAARGALRAAARPVKPVVVPVPRVAKEPKPRVVREPRERKPRASQPVKHGSMYGNQKGCKTVEGCPEHAAGRLSCVEVTRAYHREYAAKRKAVGGGRLRDGVLIHGTATGYAMGCRKRSECPGGELDGMKCADASLAAERERRRAAGILPVQAPEHGTRNRYKSKADPCTTDAVCPSFAAGGRSCREANVLHQRELAEKKRARAAASTREEMREQ